MNLFVALFLLLVQGVAASPYSDQEAQICVYLSAATSCDPATYTTRTYVGPTTGFIATLNFTDKQHDAAGLVGYLPSSQSIYVVYRGTTTAKNWLDDLDIYKKNYDTFPECKCEVHKGWYDSMLATLDLVLEEVSSLRNQFPEYDIKITGHSMGGAEAHLSSMEFLKRGIPVAAMYNFGQPRVGDSTYAAFAAPMVLPFTYRVVHHQDVVPHTPMQAMGFQHVCTEVYESNSVYNGTVVQCGSWENCGCEDKSCSNQWGTSQMSSDDHVHYLGLEMHCEAVSR